jgi:hypothetical protein
MNPTADTESNQIEPTIRALQQRSPTNQDAVAKLVS